MPYVIYCKSVIFVRHTSPEASAIGVTNALFQFHSSHFKQTRINWGLAREAETSLYPTNIRVVGQQPRRPSSNPFGFRTGVQIAHRVLDTTTGTF